VSRIDLQTKDWVNWNTWFFVRRGHNPSDKSLVITRYLIKQN